MSQFEVDQIWLLWTAAQEAILGLEPDSKSAPPEPGLYFVIGHSLDLSSGNRDGENGEALFKSRLLGVFSADFPRVALSWTHPVDRLEVMHLKGHTVSPVITIRLEANLESYTASYGSDYQLGAGFVTLSEHVSEELQNTDNEASLSFSTFWGDDREANPVYSDAKWVARFDIIRPAKNLDIPCTISVGNSSRIHPGSGSSFSLYKLGYPSRYESGSNYDEPQFIENFRNNRFRWLGLRIIPPNPSKGGLEAKDFDGLRLMRIPRMAYQFKKWKQSGQIAVGDVGEMLGELFANFLRDAWEMQIERENIKDLHVDDLIDAARQSVSGLNSDGLPIEMRLNDISNDIKTTTFDPKSGTLHLALLAAGDHIVIADELQRQFKFADSLLSQTFIAFEATDNGLRLISGKYGVNSMAIAPMAARIKAAAKRQYGDSSSLLPEPLGSWITENDGPRNIDGIAPGSLAIAIGMGLAPKLQQGSTLRWDNYSRDPAAYLLAKLLCPGLTQSRQLPIGDDASILHRALSVLGFSLESPYFEKIEDELAAIAFLWKLSDDEREAFQTLVRVQAPIEFNLDGTADMLKSSIDGVRNVRAAASQIELDGLVLNADCRSLLQSVSELPRKISDFDNAIYTLEQLIGLEREFEADGLDGDIETLKSIRDMEELSSVFDEHISTLEGLKGRSVSESDIQNYRDFFNKNREHPSLLEHLLSKIERKYSDVLEPAIDKEFKKLLNQLLHQLGNPAEANFNALSDSKRSPSKVNRRWSAWRNKLDSSEGYNKVTPELKNTANTLAETAEASRMFSECEQILLEARERGILPPRNLGRQLRIWPHELDHTYDLFKSFKTEHLDKFNDVQKVS